ncbi:MAG TPA: phosphopantetheine-binding protein [Thermomonospora sp.]|nr:phosphopantetheine-binding protein [Thermomonospora sp.]
MPRPRALRVLVVCTDREPPPGRLGERERAAAPPGGERRRRWLRSRHAQRTLLGVLGLPGGTTAHRYPNRRLSLTHTDRCSAVAGVVGPLPPPLAGVGLDLEPPRPADPRTARFFLDDREQGWLADVPERRRAEEHVRLWTLKEALFKADPGNAAATLRDYAVHDPAAPHGPARRDRSGLAFGYVTGRIPAGRLSVALSLNTRPAPARRTPDMPAPALDFAQVTERISGVLSIPAADLTPQTPLRSLTMDSFVLVELIVDLQEEFDAVFSQAELKEVETLGELVDLLRTAR